MDALHILLLDDRRKKDVFFPNYISGLDMWFKADAITGLSDGDPIATWADQSGEGNDIIQGTSAKKPLYKTNVQNSLPTVRFDGTDDLLSNTAVGTFTGTDTPFTICGVFKFSDLSDRHCIWCVGTDGVNYPYIYMIGNSTPEYLTARRDDSMTEKEETAGTPETASFHCFSYVFDGTTVDLYIDGSLVMDGVDMDVGACNDFDTVGLGYLEYGGGTFFLQGDIGEIVIFDTALSDANIENVEGYLTDKWGL